MTIHNTSKYDILWMFFGCQLVDIVATKFESVESAQLEYPEDISSHLHNVPQKSIDVTIWHPEDISCDCLQDNYDNPQYIKLSLVSYLLDANVLIGSHKAGSVDVAMTWIFRGYSYPINVKKNPVICKISTYRCDILHISWLSTR